MGKHIPGNPTVSPSNMPGAGSIVSAAAIANTLPKDGTQIGAIYASAMLEPLLGDGSRLKYDPSKFQNLGSASREVYTCAVRNDAPAKTLADARKVELIVGATAEGGTTVDYPAMSNAFLGTKFKVVRGYKGSREVTLAMERGEVQGACGLAWSTLSVQYPRLFEDKIFTMFAQEDMDGHPALNARGVPVTGKLMRPQTLSRRLNCSTRRTCLGAPMSSPPKCRRIAPLRCAPHSWLRWRTRNCSQRPRRCASTSRPHPAKTSRSSSRSSTRRRRPCRTR